jgi:hypothetical protein
MTKEQITQTSEQTTPTSTEFLQIGCSNIGMIGIVWLFSTAFRLTIFSLFFPLFLILFLIINSKLRWIPENFIVGSLILLLLLCVCSPIDIAFRQGTSFDVKFLPVLEDHGAKAHIRQAIAEGKRKNVDFIVISAGCTGTTFANHAVVIFYPSRHTSSFEYDVTPKEAEKEVQETLEMMEEIKNRTSP